VAGTAGQELDRRCSTDSVSDRQTDRPADMAGAGSGNHRSRSAAADPGSRVARWFIFKPKIPICAYFVGPWYWYFYNHSEYFTAIWKIVWQFGIFCGNLIYFPVLVGLDRAKSGNPAWVWAKLNGTASAWRWL
jgi:hypothetical protein